MFYFTVRFFIAFSQSLRLPWRMKMQICRPKFEAPDSLQKRNEEMDYEIGHVNESLQEQSISEPSFQPVFSGPCTIKLLTAVISFGSQ
jgi:hypothetical protein